MSAFATQLAVGKAGESAIARWLMRKGWSVMPVYEKTDSEYKGPQLYSANCSLIAPDLFIFRSESALWIEAKHKSGFTYHRNTGTWVHGIDIRHYEHYLAVQKLSRWAVWLLFLTKGQATKGTDEAGPRGLFGERLDTLADNEHHRHWAHGSGGMVYWAVPPLRAIANLEDVLGVAECLEDY